MEVLNNLTFEAERLEYPEPSFCILLWTEVVCREASLTRAKRKTIKEILKFEWSSFLNFAIPFLSDLGKSLLILGAIYFFGWILGIARDSSIIDPERAAALERLHFWATYAVYAMISLSFLIRLGISCWSDNRDREGL